MIKSFTVYVSLIMVKIKNLIHTASTPSLNLISLPLQNTGEILLHWFVGSGLVEHACTPNPLHTAVGSSHAHIGLWIIQESHGVKETAKSPETIAVTTTLLLV